MSSRVLWRRLDMPGHEICTLQSTASGWELSGAALVAHNGQPCRLSYLIMCDRNWQTRSLSIRGEIGTGAVQLDLSRDDASEWTSGVIAVPEVTGCIDVDMGFSPSTNLLPIRRLALGIGECAAVRAAWVKFPDLSIEVLQQSYTRLDENHYLYESDNGAFRRELTVSAEGFVTEYPDYWHAEAIISHPDEQ